jgi:hypothetical protein
MNDFDRIHDDLDKCLNKINWYIKSIKFRSISSDSDISSLYPTSIIRYGKL